MQSAIIHIIIDPKSKSYLSLVGLGFYIQSAFRLLYKYAKYYAQEFGFIWYLTDFGNQYFIKKIPCFNKIIKLYSNLKM